MAEEFDPYRMWLGIPPHEQPPNLYRLLGIGVFESDQDVIAGAADRQMGYVRTFQTGRYSAISQRILNELASARLTLLDPGRRAEYDIQLHKQLASALKPPMVSSPRPPAAPPPPRTQAVPTILPKVGNGTETVPQLGLSGRSSRAKSSVLAARRKRSNRNLLVVIVLALALVVLVAVIVALNSGEGGVPAGTSPTWPPASAQAVQPGSLPEPKERAAPRGGSAPSPSEPPETAPLAKPSQAADGADAAVTPDVPVPPADTPAAARPMETEEGPEPAPSEPLFPGMVGAIAAYEGHQGAVRSAVFASDGLFAFSGGDDRRVRTWNLRDGVEVPRFPEIGSPIWKLALSADGQRLWAISREAKATQGTLYAWDTSNGHETGRINLTGGAAGFTMALVPDTPQLLLGAADGTLRLLDLSSGSFGKLIRTFEKHEGAVRAVVVSSDGRWCLSSGDEPIMRLWTLADAKQVRTLTEKESPVLALAITPDGQRALSGGRDGSVRLWDLATGTLVHRLPRPSSPIISVAFSPDRARALSGSRDGVVRLWDLAAGKEICPLEGHAKGVHSVAFSPDGHWALSAGEDGTVRLWGLPDAGSPPPGDAAAPPP